MHERATAATLDTQMSHSSPSLTPASTTQLNTLTVNIQREWLSRIIAGSKKIEYRDLTNYWETRIQRVGPPPFRMRMINGMRADSPEATVLVNLVQIDFMEQKFLLHIQKVLETIRWKPAWHKAYPPLVSPAEPSVTEILDGPLISSEMVWELTDDDFNRLREREIIPLNLPSDSTDRAVFEQLLSIPQQPFKVKFTAGTRARSAVMVSAYQNYWESTLGCEVIALL